MELVYLWIKTYKNITNQGFNFSPRFECSYNTESLTITSKDHIENFFGDNINVTAIVGENGSGKSNLLDFIIKQNEYFGIFVFKDEQKDEFFIFDKLDRISVESQYEYKRNPTFFPHHRTSLLFLRSYIDINTYAMGEQLIPRHFFHFSDKRDFISDLHKNTTELFNIYLINSKKSVHDQFETGPYTTLALNQHFSYLKEMYLHKILKYYPDLERFIGQNFKVDNVEYKIKDLGSIFLASPKFKDNYKDDVFLHKMFDTFNQEGSTENRLKILCLIFSYLDEKDIQKFITEQFEIVNYIELYDLLVQDAHSYINAWNNFISVISAEKDFKYVIKEYLALFKEIRREILEFSFSPSLSSGEEKLLYLITNIYDYVLDYKGIGTTEFTIILDEPDTLLHPNWQKKLLSLLVSFIKTFFNHDTFNIIVTSHSPFILSDLPKENVIFLDKVDEKTKEKYPNFNIDGLSNRNCINVSDHINIKPFGANIHSLLSHGFFMEDGLMGEFAKSKINEIILNLNIKDYSPNTNEKMRVLRIIKSIGEEFLKSKLLDMFYKKFDDDFLKEQRKQELMAQQKKIALELEKLI